MEEKNGAVVAHNKRGEQHPIHKLFSIKQWLEQNNSCLIVGNLAKKIPYFL
jgi:hypothetical protein